MRTGPPPLPTQLKVLRGTLRKDRENPAEPRPLPVTSLAAPAWLTDEGRKMFRRLARLTRASRTLSDTDLPLLALLADQWAVYLAADTFLKAHGDTYWLRAEDKSVRAVMPYPQVAIRNKSALLIARLSAEFGLSPSSRSRVNAIAGAEPEDKLEAFLKVGGARG